MKKLLMVVFLLLGVAGAGAGYYLFYYKPQQDLANQAAAVEDKADEKEEEKPQSIADLKPENMEFYVDVEKLGIREAASLDAFVQRYLYKGEKVRLLEKKNGWGRVSAYFVYEQGGPEIAEWIPLDGLVEQAPVITVEERKKTIQGYIAASDDLLQFEDMFLTTTDKLLNDGSCSPVDFEELGGWVKSTKYADRDVYFIYCGGLKLADKIYLDVRTGEVFY
ncbi:SH3 domain-containing protein [Vibrio plantisponsor]|uniref:SH3 domain-containing protein n=1 Tax=Vibrio plantisponsor TaxID=664643 RepID=A0ABU4IKJ6_9VIBR|nr:SH3 domain-containing protein [Vibrio plantisponsor]MDW6019076.1 SH3 domain-containing protein [Vibrio plantisponsor]NNM41092.1 SH3 domain-containing protein [Vibrio plantisponsor]